jgi:hypothetical protein
MRKVTATRALLLSAVAGAGVVGGALFFGAGIVSADDPTPAPDQQQSSPTPGQGPAGQHGQHDPADCPHMNNDSGTAPGATNSGGPNGAGAGFRMQQRGPRA